MEIPQSIRGPMTTADSAASGRLKVDAGKGKKRKAIIRRQIRNNHV
jgi:hypothetical protein